MRRDMHPALRRSIALILISLTATGCSKAVEIPRSDIDNPKYREPGSYRVRLKGPQEYLVKRFSVTDSTVVIEELSPGDENFRFARESLPIAVPKAEVTSISKIQANEKTTFAVVAGSAVIIAALVSWIVDGISLE